MTDLACLDAAGVGITLPIMERFVAALEEILRAR
jgi:hypothetical protein